MSDLVTLIAQLSGSNQQSASDPAMAAVKLARASLDALVLKLGQTIDAKVVGQLAAGLTQLSAGGDSFVLKLETPLPTGTAVTIKVAPGPQGTPAVTVSIPAATPHAAPLPIPTSTAPLVQAQAPQPTSPSAPQPQPLPQTMPPPLATPPTPPGFVPAAKPMPQPAAPAPAAAAQPTTAALPQANAPQPPPASTPLSPQAQPAATPIVPSAAPPPVAATIPAAASTTSPLPAKPAAQVALPVAAPPQRPVEGALQPEPPPATRPAAMPVTPLPAAPAAAVPLPAAPVAAAAVPPTTAPMAPATPAPPASPPSSVTAQPAPILTTPLAAQPQQPLPTHPSPYPAHVPHPAAPVVAQQLPLPAAQPAAPPVTPRPAAPPLNLADPAQAAARQDSVAPLLAKLAAIVTVAAPSVPRPVLEAAQKLLANRIDLNRAAPDGKSLEAAVLKAGVLLTPLTREAPADSKSALLALRSTLLAFVGGDATAPVETTARPAPPIKGEPPRAPVPQAAPPDLSADGPDTARTLLGHTDAALSRLKLLQSASQPSADTRVDAPAPRNELRVEIPMLLGAETGILQLMVERDGKQKRDPERLRGWRMRFAMNFTTTGEVGADIAMLGRSASIAIWAADPDTADALDELLPELAPAIQRHGLELTSLRVRRGAPQHARTAPGQLLDSAR